MGFEIYISSTQLKSSETCIANFFSLVCVPELPDGEPFLRNQESQNYQSEKEGSDPAQVKLRGFNYEVLKEIYL